MLDGTLKKPFIPRKEDGRVRENNSIIGDHCSDGLDLLAILENTRNINEEDNLSDEIEDSLEPLDRRAVLHTARPRLQTKLHMSYQVKL